MLPAIDLNDQAPITADEVNVIRSDRPLARDLESTESPIA
jgi:hypothetical protein